MDHDGLTSGTRSDMVLVLPSFFAELAAGADSEGFPARVLPLSARGVATESVRVGWGVLCEFDFVVFRV